jgi:phosphoribosylformimino-5-aminoimidazole carboxamide ribotide isomerase
MLIPAIDLMDGEVVRLLKGEEKTKTSYRAMGDPVKVAKTWEKQGAEYLHIIDLDAALGLGDNRETIRNILGSTGIPVQVGGGIRSHEYAKTLFEEGVNRIMVGSMAFNNIPILKMILSEYGSERIIVALDHSNNLIKTKGWREGTEISILTALNEYSELGAELFLVTDIERDGTLEGPDIENLRRVITEDYRIIVAGGISSISDLIKVKELGAEAVIVGKALYEGRFNLFDALKKVN